MQLNLDAVFLLHNLIVATAAFAFARVFTQPWAVVGASLGVAFAASLGWRTLTPALSFTWDKWFLEGVVDWLRFRWSQGEPWAAVFLFWIVPIATASLVVIIHGKWLRDDCLSPITWAIVELGLLLAVGVLLLAVVVTG